jgi:hypothetical protein
MAWPGITAREFACLSLADSILKKFEDEKSATADEKALTKFLEANTHCGTFAKVDETLLSEVQAIAIGEAKSCYYDFWFNADGTYWLSLDEIVKRASTGPGSSIGASGTSYYHKIASSVLTSTRGSLLALFKRAAAEYHLWDEAEKIRSNHYGGVKLVPGNVLSFVPKSADVSRTICTEPLLNMFFQKGIASQFRERLDRRFGINLSVQPLKNQKLCAIGSVDQSFGTIDLSSASDTISYGLIKSLTPPYVLAWMDETRSPVVKLPGKADLLPLHMVSSMGNDFTFPLQTILFSSIVIGVYRALDIEPIFPRGRRLGNFGVFGDDIIVRREAYDLVINLLGRFGFFVNTDKSFNTGPFRESCGKDYFSGQDVRGIYCQSLKGTHDVYSLINRLNVWSANHDVPLPETVSYLTFGTGVRFLPVPVWETDTAGVKVPLWMVDRERARRSETGAIVYKRYEVRPRTLDVLSIESRPQYYLKRYRVIYNEPGLYLAVVGGYIRDGKLILRQEKRPNYRLRDAVAPSWDIDIPAQKRGRLRVVASHTITCREEFHPGGWQRWQNHAVWFNLARVEPVVSSGKMS